MKEVYLIRHAQTHEAAQGLSQTLNAEIDATTIDPSKFAHLIPARVYSSPVKRAIQTADILFGEYEVLDYIHEYVRPRLLDGKSKLEGKEFWDWALIEYRNDPNWKHDGSESFAEVVQRATRLLEFLRENEYKPVAIVGHSIFFRHLLGVLEYGEDYSPKTFLDIVWHTKWDNLEIKKIDI